MTGTVKLTVNGTVHEVTSPPDTPLLWVLRDELKLTGTKFGCGMAMCGSCTVHINGGPMRSCVLPISAVGGDVVTIEGLGDREKPHPLQTAWAEISVPQCGYCQSGQIMSAAALLSTNAQPTDDDINAAMAGNICRCGAYPRIRKAIKKAAAMMPQAEPPTPPKPAAAPSPIEGNATENAETPAAAGASLPVLAAPPEGAAQEASDETP